MGGSMRETDESSRRQGEVSECQCIRCSRSPEALGSPVTTISTDEEQRGRNGARPDERIIPTEHAADALGAQFGS
jgi:hypothetical protein